MADLLNAAVALSRCQATRDLYALRFEMLGKNRWRADWAFPIKEIGARREGYDRTQIRGGIEMDENFPGCPSCSALGVLLCSCGKLTCNDGRSDIGKCAWCGNRAKLEAWDDNAVIDAGIDV